MATTTYTNAKGVSLVDYHSTFVSGVKTVSWDWKKIVSQKRTKRKTEQVYSYSTLPKASRTGELEPFYIGEMAELPATTFNMYKYTIGWSRSYESKLYENHVKDQDSKAGKSMGRSLAYVKEEAVAAIFNDSFDTQTVYDGSYLCSTHTTRSGDSVDNALSAASLSVDNLWAMVNYYNTSMYNHEGLRFTARPKYVLTNPINQQTLETILKADRVPDSSDWNKNVLPTLTPIYCHFLDSTTAYWVLSEDFADDLWVFTVDEPKYVQEDDKLKHGTTFLAWSIFGVGIKEYFNIVGNPGA